MADEQQFPGISKEELNKIEQPDVTNNPERIPDLVEQHGEIAVWPHYEYWDEASKSVKRNDKVKQWLDKGNLPEDIERQDYFPPEDARHMMILRKKKPPLVGANTPPPGSSESFNDFKDRIMSTMADLSLNNEGHNTIIVSHSKVDGVIRGAEHAGWPEDGNISMSKYDEAREKPPGNHEEISIPGHVANYLHNLFFEPNPGVEKGIEMMNQKGEQLGQSFRDWASKAWTDPQQFAAENVGPGTIGAYIPKNPSMVNMKSLIDKPETWYRTVLKSLSEGMSVKDIAKEWYVPETHIQTYVNRYGERLQKDLDSLSDEEPTKNMPATLKTNPDDKVTMEVGETTRGKHPGKYPWGHFKENGQGLKELKQALDEGKNYNDLVKQFGVSKPRIAKILKDNGLESPPHVTWSKVDTEEAMKMYNDGMTWEDIAQEYGVSAPSLVKTMKQRGLIEGKGPRTKSKPSEWMYEYDENGNVIGQYRTVGK